MEYSPLDPQAQSHVEMTGSPAIYTSNNNENIYNNMNDNNINNQFINMNNKSNSKNLTSEEIWRSSNLQQKLSIAALNKDVSTLKTHINPFLDSSDICQLDAICALHWASYCGDIKLVETLLRIGCNPYQLDILNGDIAVHYAVKGAQFETVKLLVDSHQNNHLHPLNFQNNKHMTPFLTASAESLEDKIPELLRIMEWMYLEGVSVETQDENGQTALFWAAKRGSLPVVQWLLARGSNMNHRDHMGNSVLHLACSSGDEDTILFLCNRGAIKLVESTSLEDEKLVGSSVYNICWLRGHYFLYFALWQWAIQYKYFGIVRIFKSPYASYYWMLSAVNAGLFVHMWMKLIGVSHPERYYIPCGLWIIFWVLTQLFWLLCYGSDPGYAKKGAIKPQFDRITMSLSEGLDIPPVYSAKRNRGIAQLQAIEREQLLATCEMIELNRYCLKQFINPKKHHRYQQCLEKLMHYKKKCNELLQTVGKERQAAMSSTYVDAVTNGYPSPKTVCVTCKHMKPARVHHCADCGHCIKREDHHCIWVDNCVGINTQRSFWLFLLFLSTSLLLNYYIMILYFINFYDDPAQWLWYFGIFMNGGVLNSMWTLFVLYLLIRTTKAMFTGITFLEYLKKPEHVRRRFRNQVDGFCWDAKDATFQSFFSNIWTYWTLSDDPIIAARNEDAKNAKNLKHTLSKEMKSSKHAYQPLLNPSYAPDPARATHSPQRPGSPQRAQTSPSRPFV